MKLRRLFTAFSRSLASRQNQPRARLKVETLESRLVPYAISGNAWPHPELVTLSFQPDGTNLGGVTSNLFGTMDAKWAPSVWQREILRAAQVWAQVTNLNFALVSDNGTDSGSGGYQQGDPTFGDIRIGAYNAGGSNLGSAMMPPPVNNYSVAGDYTLNSSQNWVINQTGGYDLFTVAAHEMGHALGLYHSTVSTAEEYSFYNAIKNSLRPDDIAGIKAIYSGGLGRSQDGFDAVLSNGSFATATNLTPALDLVTKTALVKDLDLTTTSDHDYYSVVAPVGTTGNLTVKVQSSGLSMLMPTVTVYNAFQQPIGSASGVGQYGSTLSVTINGALPGQLFFIKVSPAETSAFGTGKYALTLNFGSGASPTVPLPNTQTLNGNPISGGGGIATRDGSEIQVNQTILGAQVAYSEESNRNAYAVNSWGMSVATWSSQDQDGDGWGVYARLFGPDGVPWSDEFQVNIESAGDQKHAAAAVDDNGNYIIAWTSRDEDGSWGIRAQRFDLGGTPAENDLIVAAGVGDQSYPIIATDPVGNYIIAWTSQGEDGSGLGTYAQRYDSAGEPLGGAFLVNTSTAGDQKQPAVAMDPAGSFVFAWTSQHDSTSNVYGKLYDAEGGVLRDEFLVNSTTAGAQEQPSVAMSDDGDVVMSWSSLDQDGAGWGVYMQRYTNTGLPRDMEQRVNTTVSGNQWFSSIAAMTNGATVVTWTAFDELGVTTGIFAQQFTAAGEMTGPEILVNTTLSGDQLFPSIAADKNGSFGVLWTGQGSGDADGIYMQHYNIPGGGGVAGGEDDFYGVSDHGNGCGCAICQSAFVGETTPALVDGSTANALLQAKQPQATAALLTETNPTTTDEGPSTVRSVEGLPTASQGAPTAGARVLSASISQAPWTTEPEQAGRPTTAPAEDAFTRQESAHETYLPETLWTEALDVYFAEAGAECQPVLADGANADASEPAVSDSLEALPSAVLPSSDAVQPLAALAGLALAFGGYWCTQPLTAAERRARRRPTVQLRLK